MNFPPDYETFEKINKRNEENKIKPKKLPIGPLILLYNHRTPQGSLFPLQKHGRVNKKRS